jgi:DNA sulfur modification protein DndD
MANTIISLSFQNFYNYYGSIDRNTYSFNEGLNIIVADNGCGKSKFFNGILWLLNDKVYDSELKITEGIQIAAFKMISDKAKVNANKNDVVETCVELVYRDNKFEYQITKKISAKKKNEDKPSDKNNWHVIIEDPKVSRKDLLLLNFKPVYDNDDKQKIISNIININFRQYSLLQGEAIDNIVDLLSKDGLLKTVEALTNIDRLKDLVKTSSGLRERAERELRQVERDCETNNVVLAELIIKEEEEKIKLKKLEEDESVYIEEYNAASSKESELLNRISNATDRAVYREKIEAIEKERKRLIDTKDKLLSSINDNFFKKEKPWLILGFDNSIDVFITHKEDYLEKRTQNRLLKQIEHNPNDFFTVLPDGSPDTVSLKKMLDDEKCYVCGRPAIKDSADWLHIKNVKDRPKVKIENTKNDFASFFGEIQSGVSGFYNSIEEIFEDIKQKRQGIQSIDSQIAKLDSDEKDATEKLTDCGGVLGEDQKITDQKDIAEFDSAKEKKKNADSSIKSTNEAIEKCKLRIKKIATDIKNCKTVAIDSKYEAIKEYLINIEAIFYQTQVRVFDKVLKKLEFHSNNHFQKLTVGNNVNGGILKFKKTPNDTISLEVVDSNGNIITGQSEGFQRMKKLAIVMAIITSKRENMLFDYPLIADAPLGTYGKNFILNFFSEVPQVFGQSIILVKELYDPDDKVSNISELGKEILSRMTSGLISGTFYVNLVENSSVPSELETSIKCYKS